MISKAKVKYIKSLQIKKYRKLHGEFVVEGAKSVLELLRSDFQISSLYLTGDFLKKYGNEVKSVQTEVFEVKQNELEELGTFSSNNAALAVAKVKENKPLHLEGSEYILVLDEIKDPGNLGTIIRIADWYGIGKIVCSTDSAEVYNPKVISSTMGSFTRIHLYYCDLKEYLNKNLNATVYGALLEGTDIHKVDFTKSGYLIMGNESSGISAELIPLITQQVSIPRKGHAESLNVSVATGIICDAIFN